MADKLSTAFLRSVHNAAARAADMQDRLTAAMVARYGCTHSDVDCEGLIEALDYGRAESPTLAECDQLMAECGIVAGEQHNG